MKIDTYSGGLFDTNAFFIETDDGNILIDAPQGVAEWLAQRGHRVRTLLITHGHFDHTIDAAKIQRDHGAQIGCHRDTAPFLTDPQIFQRYGFQLEIEPCRADFLLEETAAQKIGGIEFQILHVPGHCPGSLCFLANRERTLFGGDVLFAGSIGRTDLPAGDHDLLINGIRHKILPLGDDITVLSGHGPATKIGIERETNPFLR